MISCRQHAFVPSLFSYFLIAESLFRGDSVAFYARSNAILSFVFFLRQIIVLALSSLLQLPVLDPVIFIASSVAPLAPILAASFFLLGAFRSFVFSLQRVSSHSPVSHPLLLTLAPRVAKQVFVFRFEITLPFRCVPLYVS